MPILIDQWFKGPSPTCESGKYERAERGAVRSLLAFSVRFDLPNNQGEREWSGHGQAGESGRVVGNGGRKGVTGARGGIGDAAARGLAPHHAYGAQKKGSGRVFSSV
jgi:hypothetical protein